MTHSTNTSDDAVGAPPVPAQRRDGQGVREALRVITLVVALGIAAVGLVGGLLGLLVSLLGNAQEQVLSTTVSVSLLALAGGLGLALAWHAWRAIQGHDSPVFRPRKPWLLIPAFLLAVALGQTVLSLGLLPPLLFPPFHVLAAVLPPLTILALVARGLEGAGRWRDAVLQLGSGAFLATPLALVLEAGAIVSLLALSLGGLLLRPGGRELLRRMADLLAESTWVQDPANLFSLFNSPALVLAALVIVAGLVPLIEELAKTVGVGLMAYRRPNPRQAFLWGLAGGAGFAMVEGLFNTIGSLEGWAPVLLLRVGASLLHCTAGALMGLAWYQVLAGRRWLRALAFYAGSVAIHAGWNTVSIGIAVLSLSSEGSEGGSLSGLGSVWLVAALVALSVGMGLLLGELTRRLAKRSLLPVPLRPQPAEETQL